MNLHQKIAFDRQCMIQFDMPADEVDLIIKAKKAGLIVLLDEETTDSLKSKLSDYAKECYMNGFNDGQENNEPFDDGLDADISEQIGDIFSDFRSKTE